MEPLIYIGLGFHFPSCSLPIFLHGSSLELITGPLTITVTGLLFMLVSPPLCCHLSLNVPLCPGCHSSLASYCHPMSSHETWSNVARMETEFWLTLTDTQWTKTLEKRERESGPFATGSQSWAEHIPSHPSSDTAITRLIFRSKYQRLLLIHKQYNKAFQELGKISTISWWYPQLPRCQNQ